MIAKTMNAAMNCQTLLLSTEAAEAVTTAMDHLQLGEPIIIPTETVFGITANAEREDAVRRLFELKGRDLTQPSAIFLPEIGDIDRYALIEHDYAREIISEYLPGPLTVVLSAKVKQWPGVVGDDGKIGIRVSSDKFVRTLLEEFGRPLLATSANRSGGDECLSLAEVKTEFESLVPLILYHQEERLAQASTVVDLSGRQPRVLRRGALDLQARFASWFKER